MIREIAGARWWKFDFHTHTPFSTDTAWHKQIGKADELTPEGWLRKFMEAGIDCVAITDHNGGGWVDPLKSAYADLVARSPRPEWFRELHLFPGVEISVNGGIHLLALFGKDATSGHIDSLLGAVGFTGKRGDPSERTQSSLTAVLEAVSHSGGIPIPAHADIENGLLRTDPKKPDSCFRDAKTVEQVLKSRHVFAAEFVSTSSTRPAVYRETKAAWTEVLGTDCSNFRGPRPPGSAYTWVKMGTPTLDGLRLALLDGAPLSIRRSDEATGDPNEHAELVIEAIEIRDARVAGRGKPLEVRFSPWLSTLIGSRGSGKSTVVEFLRLALGRKTELPENSEILDLFQVPKSRDKPGGLTGKTAIDVFLRKDGQRFRVRWAQGSPHSHIEEFVEEKATWKPAPGKVQDRFPVRIFSQKQIFALSGSPGGLLDMIDGAPAVRGSNWAQEFQEAEARYLRLRTQFREIGSKLDDRSKLEGELADVKRKLAAFESGGSQDAMREYQRFRRQRRHLDERAGELGALPHQLEQLAEEIAPSDQPSGEFDADCEVARDALDWILEGIAYQRGVVQRVSKLAAEVEAFKAGWLGKRAALAWALREREVETGYQSIVTALQEAGVRAAEEYGPLVQRRQLLEKKLAEIERLRGEATRLEGEACAQLEEVLKIRRKRTDLRSRFLGKVLPDDGVVRIKVVPYGNDPASIESEFRSRLGKDGGAFQNDILSEDRSQGMLAALYAGLPAETAARRIVLESRISGIKAEIDEARRAGVWASRGRLLAHVQKLREDQLDHLRLWWPDDTVEVEYRNDPKSPWRSIEQGSAGQRSAAILAFVLSFGDEPIVLDQPEDDLDNHLITELVVQQIRSMKARRQVIVATHNPNIVVNGDAERVIALRDAGGQCRVLNEGTGCLQERAVRDEICQVMEGGRKAFEERYRRIAQVAGDA